MSGTFIPGDQAQRERIASALDETLFVQAGAGTGKTKSLVSRIVTLITSDRANVDSIAAITFTEAAAAELRDRVRRELEAQSIDTRNSSDERKRCLNAVRGLENASIQTLHSFAAALLKECPLEAGLPPNYEVTEEIEADINFEERWQQWLDEALDSETMVPHLHRALSMGLRLENLKTVAKSFHDNYNLLPGSFPPLPEPAKEAVCQVIEASGKIRRLLPLAINGADDVLASYSNRLAELGDRLATLDADSDAALSILTRWGKLSFSKGKQSDWDTNPATDINGCKELKTLFAELESAKNKELEAVRRAILMPLLESLRRFALDYVEERRRRGKAEFHDLLVWARNLIRDNPDVRAHFQKRFTHILIDEFQDTDPIQAEIAFFLSEASANDANFCGNSVDWTAANLAPGKLFVVGDPKQSIYRFRRADIAAVEQVHDLMGGNAVPLTQNFRSQESIIDWVNFVFSQWMGQGVPGIQSPYLELIARWTPPETTPPLGVHWFGEPSTGKAASLRRQEATAITTMLQDIKSGPWMVRDEGKNELRNANYKDVCILIPTRTGLQALERALETANIPYRVESQSLVLGTQDVREMLACLRAIDSPADQIALVASLRSSAFGCSDVELLQFVENGGRLDYVAPGTTEGPVKDALNTLYRYHQERTWTQLDEIIERFIRERRMAEVCFGRTRPRERLRRLRFVVERARAFARVGGNSLRSFLDWIERQASENARMVEIPIPETDEDAVRIMTIHGAKGLEFPVVILAGIGSQPTHKASPVIFDRRNHSVEVSVGTRDSAFSTGNYEAAQEQQNLAEEAEGIRLMYVSATRARDHLVVSLFHSTRNQKSPAAVINHLCSTKTELWHEITLSPLDIRTESPSKVAKDTMLDTEADRDAWLEHRGIVLQRASRPAAVAVTTIVRMDKEEAERGEVPYRRGRGGTSMGRAVHSVLQSVDLVTAAGLEQMSKAQAAVEGITNRWQEVAELARRGLESVVVKRAIASGRYYREVFVSIPLGEERMEGFIDLLFEDDGGFVIADYKTDVIDNETTLLEDHKQYALQAGIYAFALSKVTGKAVREVVLVFLRSDKEIVIGNIDSLKTQAYQHAMSTLHPLHLASPM